MEICKIFNMVKESNTLVTLYWYLSGTFLPYTDTGMGYCLFGHRYCRTSIQIDESDPHFSILTNHSF